MNLIDAYILNPKLLVYIHVVAGFIALIMAPVAMRTQKGGKQHRRWGKVYFWAMFVIFVSALGLLYFRPNFFLFMISILSFYGAFSGYRALYRKNPARGEQAIWLDWAAAAIALTAGAGFMTWGILSVAGVIDIVIPGAFGFIAVGFGFFLASDAYKDMRSFRQPPADRNWWWYYHIEHMSGSYIAAVTAFAVQNLTRLMPVELMWLPWVIPVAVGAPLIARTIRAYRQKFNQPRAQKGVGEERVFESVVR
jgi:uncharacterized membrane protein